jgi:uncharacterized protein (DUF58 family)
MVKEFELDPLAEVWLIVDAERSVNASKPYQQPEFDPREVWRKKFKFDLPPSTVEYAVTAAASLARFYIQRGRSVGLVYADQSLRILPSDRGGRQLGKMLEALALLRPEGSMPLQSLVETQARYLPRGSTVVMITPSSSDSVYKTADLLLRRGLRPVVVLLDSATFGGYYSSDRVIGYLDALGVPYCHVVEGADIGNALSIAANLLQRAAGS